MPKPAKKPAKKRTKESSSDAMTRARRLLAEGMQKASRPPKRTLTLSELGVMMEGPGPFDDAHVLAKMPVRPSDLSADTITPISKARHTALMSKAGRKGGKIGGAKRMAMSLEQRKAMALVEARARWKKRPKL
jgi:hypothetical protein